jgi:hypothetical protein
MNAIQTSSLAGLKKSSALTLSLERLRSGLDPEFYRARAARRVERIQASKPSADFQHKAAEATRDSYVWATQHTKTFNQHWVEEGRPSAYEYFPGPVERPDLPAVFEFLASNERIIWWEKSRDMMLSWACVAYLTLNAMKFAHREVLFQTQKEDKAKQLVYYAKTLYDQQPGWLQEQYPLTKPVWTQPELELHFRDGGSIIGIPGGADQIRSYHPWGYLNDESSFQPDAGECYNEALSAVKGKIIFNSSAGPGWYADVRKDIVVNRED